MKSIKFLLCLWIAFAIYPAFAAKTIMTRESGVGDLWTSFGTNGSTLNTNVDNPLQTGINTSLKCIQNTTSGGNWYDRGKIWGDAISVDADNRYLHIMVYTPGSSNGKAMIVIKPNNNSEDQFNDYQGDNKDTDIRFDIPAGVWTDRVIDLQARNISLFSEIYFADQNWSGSSRNYYYDDIVLNADPNPRTSSTNGTGGSGNTTSVLADFESAGVNPSSQDNGGCASNSLTVTDNLDKSCVLNTTNKALYAQTNGSNQDWWKGIEIDVADFTVATATARYLHILMRTDLPKFEWDVHTDQDNWAGASTTHGTDNTWFDYIIDLQSIKGSTNLNEKTVTTLRIAFSCNESANRSKEIRIDEIILSNTPDARGVCTGSSSDVSDITIDVATEYQTIEGFGASDCWMGNFVGKWTGNNKANVAKWLFSQKFGSDDNPEGIGLSIWRFNLGAGTYELGNTGNNVGDNVDTRVARRAESFLADVNTQGTYNWDKCAGQRYFLQQAKTYGCESFVAFSNSPVIPFTKNGQGYSGSSSNANISTSGYAGFAGYMVDVVKHFKDAGYNFNYISPLNEPQWDWNDKNQEGSPWTNSEIKTMVTALNSSITTKGLTGTKIMITDAGQWDYLYGQTNDDAGNQIYQFFDSGSSNYVGNLTHVDKTIAGHSYWTDKNNSNIKSVRQQVKTKADQYNLGVHQTEWSMMETDNVNGFPSNWDYIDVALNMAKIIHSDMAYANAASWSYWTAMYMEQWSQKNRFMLVHVTPNNDEYANTHAALETEGPVEAEPTLWALGNYSLFVRPGYKRIDITNADDLGGLMGTSYMAPDQSKIVIVYVNMAITAKTVSITFKNLGNITPYQYTGYETSSSHSLKKVFRESYTSANEVNVAARSVLTVVYDCNQPWFTWQGTTNTQWTEATNWIDDAIPTATDRVLIPAGCTRYPVLTASKTVKHVSIEKGATIDVNNYILTVTKGVKVIMPVEETASDNSVSVDCWFPVGFPFSIETVGSQNFEEAGYEPSNLYPYEDDESDLANPPYNNSGWLGDYLLKEYIYDGSGNPPFHYTQDAFVAGKGYIIKFPEWFSGDIISFMSPISNTVFNGTLVEPSADYKLVANNDLKDIKLNNSSNTYYYAFVPDEKAFKLITEETTIHPFEAYIVVITNDPDISLRSSFAVDEITPVLKPSSEIDDPVVSERYYDLQGIEITQPVNPGIYIVRKILQSGAEKIVKQIKIKR
jgi:O-glycosyl hydrolase